MGHRKEKLLLQSLGHVVMNQSYVCALIAMMVRARENPEP